MPPHRYRVTARNRHTTNAPRPPRRRGKTGPLSRSGRHITPLPRFSSPTKLGRVFYVMAAAPLARIGETWQTTPGDWRSFFAARSPRSRSFVRRGRAEVFSIAPLSPVSSSRRGRRLCAMFFSVRLSPSRSRWWFQSSLLFRQPVPPSQILTPVLPSRQRLRWGVPSAAPPRGHRTHPEGNITSRRRERFREHP